MFSKGRKFKTKINRDQRSVGKDKHHFKIIARNA